MYVEAQLESMMPLEWVVPVHDVLYFKFLPRVHLGWIEYVMPEFGLGFLYSRCGDACRHDLL